MLFVFDRWKNLIEEIICIICIHYNHRNEKKAKIRIFKTLNKEETARGIILCLIGPVC